MSDNTEWYERQKRRNPPKPKKIKPDDAWEKKQKERIQRRKDEIEGRDYTKDVHGNVAWKPGKRNKKVKHLKGKDKPAEFKKLDSQLSAWKKRQAARKRDE